MINMNEENKNEIEKEEIKKEEIEKKEIKKEEIEKKEKHTGKKITPILTGASGALATALANPIGRWSIFKSQDEIGLLINRFILNITENPDISFTVHKLYNLITNTIMAYPAILPIAGGLIAAGAGALINKKISKAKLKRKSLSKQKDGYSLQ